MTTYVYAVVRGAHPATGPLLGVGDPPAAIRLLTESEVAAVVSDTPPGLRTKRRDLIAHQSVLAELGKAGPVLPMRFGSLSPDDDSVRAVLREHSDYFLRQLAELEGRVEFNVKAAHREKPLLRRILAEDETIRELNEHTRRTGDRQERLRLGELVARATQVHRVQDAELIRRTLRPLAAADSPGPERPDCLCNHSFLVDRTAVGDFRAAVGRLQQEHEELELSAYGPLPPYSFVAPVPNRAAAG